jgi:mono/diheme cytochrome c family protein
VPSLRLHSLLVVAAVALVGFRTGNRPAATPAPGTREVSDSTDYQICAACHQATGLGLPKTFPPLAGSLIVNGPPAPHIAIVLKGLVGPVKVKGEVYNSAMAPWESLSDAQIAGAINYERTHWGNKGIKVTPADVAKIRTLLKARKTPFTAADLEKQKF